jgi:hypothetical protein
MDIRKEMLAIERLLDEIGLSRKQFQFIAGITPQTWRNWRDGRMLPQMAKWQDVLAAVDKVKSSQEVLVAIRIGHAKPGRPAKHPPKHPSAFAALRRDKQA